MATTFVAETNLITLTKPFYIMKKNKLPYIGKIQDLNDEFNNAFRDEVFMPMVTFAGTLILFTILLDYSFQLVEALDIILAN